MSIRTTVILAALAVLAGCATLEGETTTPDAIPDGRTSLPFGARSVPGLVSATPADGTTVGGSGDSLATYELPLLSPGDELALTVEDGEEFEGVYAVGLDGRLRLPYLPPIPVQGLGVDAARDVVAQAFVSAQMFRAAAPRISLQPVLWAAVQVAVEGAVFAPGAVVLNDRTHADHRPARATRSGDLALDRYLVAALRAAGGLRPDADLANVTIWRRGHGLSVDLTPVLRGQSLHGLPLLAGDRIQVPSVGVFQQALARPTSLTSPGFRIYISNLSVPVAGNAAAAVGVDATRLPTGARLTHALTSGNCLGGTHLTNAGRRALLITTHPVTREVTSHLYRVHEATGRADDPRFNPFLQPEDAIACYDTRTETVRDLARLAATMLAPVSMLRAIGEGYRDY